MPLLYASGLLRFFLVYPMWFVVSVAAPLAVTVNVYVYFEFK